MENVKKERVTTPNPDSKEKETPNPDSNEETKPPLTWSYIGFTKGADPGSYTYNFISSIITDNIKKETNKIKRNGVTHNIVLNIKDKDTRLIQKINSDEFIGTIDKLKEFMRTQNMEYEDQYDSIDEKYKTGLKFIDETIIKYSDDFPIKWTYVGFKPDNNNGINYKFVSNELEINRNKRSTYLYYVTPIQFFTDETIEGIVFTDGVTKGEEKSIEDQYTHGYTKNNYINDKSLIWYYKGVTEKDNQYVYSFHTIKDGKIIEARFVKDTENNSFSDISKMITSIGSKFSNGEWSYLGYHRIGDNMYEYNFRSNTDKEYVTKTITHNKELKTEEEVKELMAKNNIYPRYREITKQEVIQITIMPHYVNINRNYYIYYKTGDGMSMFIKILNAEGKNETKLTPVIDDIESKLLKNKLDNRLQEFLMGQYDIQLDPTYHPLFPPISQ
jgi:hypothetical protein